MSITREFFLKLQAVSKNEPLLASFLKNNLHDSDEFTFQIFLNEYAKHFDTLPDPESKNKLSLRFWEIIESLKLPIIEVNHDGSFQVYFLYRQPQGNDNDLYIQGDFHGYGSTFPKQKLNRMGDTDVMCCITPMEKAFNNALITYHFVEVPTGQALNDLHAQANWLPDPYAKNTKAYEKNESQFCVNANNDMTVWRATDSREWPSLTDIHKDPRLTHWVQHPNRQIVSGIASFENDLHSIQVFKPTQKIENVVIVNDGFAYLFCDALNHLQKFAEKEKCALIFISPMLGLGNPNNHQLGVRGFEYHENVDQYAAFILNELIPELNKQDVLPDPRPTNITVIGASISGTAALRIGLTHRDQFKHIIAHSPAPIGRDMIDRIPNARMTAGRMRIDIECGQFENPGFAFANDNLSYARELGKLLNVDVKVGLHGHQTEAWVADLKRSLPRVLSIEQKSELSSQSIFSHNQKSSVKTKDHDATQIYVNRKKGG